jgi:hypothetical protein
MKRFLMIALFLGVMQGSYSADWNLDFDWIQIYPKNDFEKFDWSVLPDSRLIGMTQELLKHHVVSDNDPITILKSANSIYALTSCRLDVLEWQADKWVNLYKGNAVGFNCKNDVFIHENRLYSYGKYGFYNGHSELFVFDFNTGYWDNVRAKNLPLQYRPQTAFYSGIGLVALLGGYINQSSGLDILEKNGFYYDFEKEQWLPLRLRFDVENPTLNIVKPSYNLEDFGIYRDQREGELGIVILDKNNLNLYFKRYNFVRPNQFGIALGFKNSLQFFGNGGKSAILNLESPLDDSFQKIGTIELLENWPDNQLSENNWKNPLLIFLSCAVFFLSLMLIRRNRKLISPDSAIEDLNQSDNNPEDSKDGLKDIIQILLPYANQILELEQVDALLGINDVNNLDYRKVKRSRLIKAINKRKSTKTPALQIVRQRLAQDKRVLVYKIVLQ